jgi:hypothetical protein
MGARRQPISDFRQAKRCAGAKPAVTSTGTQRKAALSRARSSSVRVLKAKSTKLSRAVLGLARAVGKCPPQTRTVRTVVPGPASAGSAGGLIIVPSAPGTPPETVSLQLGLPAVTESPLLDLSGVLGGDPLPGVPSAVPIDQLTSSLCTTVDALCVGIDPNQLAGLLTQAVADVPLLGPIAQPLLSQVLGLLGSGDISDLLEVRRISDQVIQLVPTGALGTLTALVGDVLGDLTGPVGRLQIVQPSSPHPRPLSRVRPGGRPLVHSAAG